MTYRWDEFVLDLDGFRLLRHDTPLALEPKAFNLLVLLIERPGHVFTKQEIFERLWPNTVVTDHALTRVVAQLRRVLGDEARDARYIETVPTRGYRWRPVVESVPVAPPVDIVAQPAAPRTEPNSRVPLSVLGLVAAIVLIAIVAWSQSGSRVTVLSATSDRSSDAAWPIQLTAHAGLDMDPSFSPQSDAIAFASDRSGAFELYVRPLTGAANEIALTSDGQGNVQPAWSPDGTLIAFHSTGRGGIWVMPARGGAARQLASEGSHPAWSADGHRIAFQSDEPSDVSPSAYGAQSGATIRLVDADGQHPRQLTSPGRPFGGHASPTWTHDDRFIAFSVFEGGRSNGVWLIDVATGHTSQLLEGLRGHYELVFAPDDSALFVAGGEPFITRIPFDRRAGAVSSARDLITVPGVAGVRGLSISSDGHRLGFAGLAVSSQIWAQPIAKDGNGHGDPYPLTTDTSRRNSFPTVSPDGTRVAYVSTRAGEPPNVWMMHVDGSHVAQLTANDTPDAQPYWFPDGKRLGFLLTREDSLGLWSIDIDTRRQELVHRVADRAALSEAAGAGVLSESTLSPSMTQVAMAIVTTPRANKQIVLSSAAATVPRTLADASHWLGYPAWSRDERRIAAELKEGSSTHAVSIDVATGNMRQLTRARGQTWVRSWSPDNSKIAAAVFRQGRWDLEWIDASNGTTGVMAQSAGPHTYVRYPEWSPRGDLVVYERGELRGNVWMLRMNDR